MPSEDDLRTVCFKEFVQLADRYTAEGWIEYLLWETLEGTRDRPFLFLDSLSEEEMDLLRVMRDEVGIWVTWRESWLIVGVEEWRSHVKTRTANDVLDTLCGKDGTFA